jgi:hypothetical protein
VLIAGLGIVPCFNGIEYNMPPRERTTARRSPCGQEPALLLNEAEQLE